MSDGISTSAADDRDDNYANKGMKLRRSVDVCGLSDVAVTSANSICWTSSRVSTCMRASPADIVYNSHM